MKILVTGGAGRIGAMVVNSLARKGHNVNVFDLPQADYGSMSKFTSVQIFKGDITDLNQMKPACEGVDVVLHLAAILPPYSERNKERTMLVNVEGTANVVEALELTSSAPLVISSSVSVYGRTQAEEQAISVDHPLSPTDLYSQSKIMAEEAVRGSGLLHTILRISGVYAAEPFEFPSPVQFKADQRVEFVDRDDVVTALVSSVVNTVEGRTLNIAGGESWRMTGGRFTAEVFDAFGVQGVVNYPSEYGYFDWYNTEDSQRLLGYQMTSFASFKKKLSKVFGTMS